MQSVADYQKLNKAHCLHTRLIYKISSRVKVAFMKWPHVALFTKILSCTRRWEARVLWNVSSLAGWLNLEITSPLPRLGWLIYRHSNNSKFLYLVCGKSTECHAINKARHGSEVDLRGIGDHKSLIIILRNRKNVLFAKHYIVLQGQCNLRLLSNS